MSEFITVAKVGDIPDQEGRAFKVNDVMVAVFNDRGKYSAIDDMCPHAGASLASGFYENGIVTCPWHAWQFKTSDGSFCGNPRTKIDVYSVRVLGDKIQVMNHPRERTDSPSVTPTEETSKTNMNKKNSANAPASIDVSIEEFQKLIREMYFEKDVARGTSGTFMWLMEEIGELSSALRSNDGSAKAHEELSAEFADVLAWLVTIANVAEVDLSAAVAKKYGSGCPGCQQFVCTCPDADKP